MLANLNGNEKNVAAMDKFDQEIAFYLSMFVGGKIIARDGGEKVEAATDGVRRRK